MYVAATPHALRMIVFLDFKKNPDVDGRLIIAFWLISTSLPEVSDKREMSITKEMLEFLIYMNPEFSLIFKIKLSKLNRYSIHNCIHIVR